MGADEFSKIIIKEIKQLTKDLDECSDLEGYRMIQGYNEAINDVIKLIKGEQCLI